jgi:SAM-dependent methyltransferase
MNGRAPGMFQPHQGSWPSRFQQDKSYPAEVDQIREILTREGPVDEILDLACGSGHHLELLAAAGHLVTGADRSAELVAAARMRLRPYGPRHQVLHMDLFATTLDRSVDVVIMMFALLSHRVSNEDALAALRAAQGQLRPGGLLIFDVLDATTTISGPAAGSGMAVVAGSGQTLLRAHAQRRRDDSQTLELSLRSWLLSDDRVIDQSEQTHRMRFYLERELDLLLGLAGFQFLGSAPLAGDETFRLVWARKT